MQALRQICAVDQTEFEARESVAGARIELAYIALLGLIGAEVELSSQRVERDIRVLLVAIVKTELEAVSPLLPIQAVIKTNPIVDVVIGMGIAELRDSLRIRTDNGEVCVVDVANPKLLCIVGRALGCDRKVLRVAAIRTQDHVVKDGWREGILP